MKRYNTYNKFILFGNAPVCVYGNVVVRAPYVRRKVRVFYFRGAKNRRAMKPSVTP